MFISEDFIISDGKVVVSGERGGRHLVAVRVKVAVALAVAVAVARDK